MQALHRKDIVHRDLKPQNILLTKDLHAKVSDMGLSKQIAPSQTSFDSYGGGGSSGWQAPEQITCTCDESGMMRQSKAVDIFSLALVLFWTLSNGEHAFGKRAFERDGRIVSGAPDLSPLDALPDVQNLLAAMLDRCAPCTHSWPLLNGVVAVAALRPVCKRLYRVWHGTIPRMCTTRSGGLVSRAVVGR